ncbi:MAG: chromosome segregation ATPase-like protein [Mesorhizobium sp.]|uniref:AAA family ATPase n=1 Tax=Mesorhizobium sp. TaxID=1871066 RepID=UPI000FEA21A8|nr:AAA family ATPase [Mesorhizobium sp.]RWK87960.1 MAG: chromosome segregation ATPase-like protein [Mesorhizobium sp.]
MLAFDSTTLVLPSLLALTALAVLMSGIATMFQIRRARLPDATRYEHVRELRAQEEGLLAQRRAELSVVEQKIQERDRLIAEVSALEERRNATNAELSNLESARSEIDEVKQQASAAAADLATVTEQLESRRAELQRVDAELDPSKMAERKLEIERLTEELRTLESAMPALRAERDAALRIVEEARSFEARQAVLERELDRLQTEIESLEVDADELREAETQLKRLREDLSRVADELGRTEARRDRLQGDIEELEAHGEAARALRSQVQELSAELGQKRTRRDELAEEVDKLVARRETLVSESAGAGIGDVDEAVILEDLTKFPPCLEFPAQLRHGPRTEAEALHTVSTYLQNHGLAYSGRTVRAFHTALKINDSAQLTVLAGVSGTGKSLLPRRYAEAMGMHFLQIAVEPRWDSPQDLLGFYNYIEKKYRATDLARLLVHMDPFREVELAGQPHERKDHMALVLLDEMNLARVEYYFSEFLSRLEARPRFSEADDERKRKDAMIPIDIRGLRKSLSLFPAHNVLFAGTMNDDESTQALSDKVLDRGNIMQFAAPREFQTITQRHEVGRPDEVQSFKSWRTWVRQPDRLPDAERSNADQVIKELAEIMESCGRPFGHRLRDAILAYTANYPASGSGGSDVRIPLADQVELRILPKLRGLEIQSHADAFDRLEKLMRDQLGDGVFSDRLADLRDKQANGTGLFVWRGLTREG